MTPTSDQTYGIFERILYGLAMLALMKAVGWGWITSAEAPYYAAGIVTAVGSVWAWWINRPKAIMQSAAAIVDPDTGKKAVIVTSPAMAASTPETNIVSNLSNKVVSQ